MITDTTYMVKCTFPGIACKRLNQTTTTAPIETLHVHIVILVQCIALIAACVGAFYGAI